MAEERRPQNQTSGDLRDYEIIQRKALLLFIIIQKTGKTFQKQCMLLMRTMSRVSSFSMVSDYGLDDRAIEVRSPAEARGFFL
jgi:hypothetical protein